MIRRRPLVLAVALAWGGVLAAQQPGARAPRPMTFEDVVTLRAVSDPQPSPDGQWIAYVVSQADTVANEVTSAIWLVRADGREPARRLTAGRKRDSAPRWSPDGTRLAFVSTREERPQLWVIDPRGGEAERLAETKTAVGAYQWSPDGTRIAFTAPRAPTAEEERRQKVRDDAIVVDTGFQFPRLHVLDVATRRVREVALGDVAASDPQWRPDGRLLAVVTTPTTKADDGSRTDIVLVAPDSGAAPRPLLRNPGPDAAPRWSPDGRTIAVLMRPQPGAIGAMRLAVVDAEGGAPRTLVEPTAWEPQAAQWAADGRSLVTAATTGTATSLFRVPLAGGTPQRLAGDGTSVLGGATLTKDGARVVAVRSALDRAGDVWVLDVATPKAAPRTVTDHNPQLRDLALGRGEVVRWTGPGGTAIEGVLVRPAGVPAGTPVPTLVAVHGGPAGVWTQAFPGSWGNAAHVWAGRGWAVLMPNPRGSVGYGEPFQLSNVKDWGGGDYGDIQAGLDTLVARGIADPARLAQTGWSYGGYMTAWTITQTTRFRAAMVGAGLTNMVSMYGTNDLQTTLEGYFGGAPWDVPGTYEARSAMTFVKQARTPTLILHGQQDLRVPVGQAQELYMGLRKNGVPSQLVFYPREPHGLGEPRHQLDKLRREYEWMARWTLGAAAPVP